MPKLIIFEFNKSILDAQSEILELDQVQDNKKIKLNIPCEISFEKDEFESIIEYVDGRIAVIAGTGANSTTEAIALTQAAKNIGADACLLVTPYYNKPTQEGLYLHYKAIAEAVDIPQILYNVPGRTACDMLPETVGRLAKIKNIVGVKEATGELERVKIIRDLCGNDFALYTIS